MNGEAFCVSSVHLPHTETLLPAPPDAPCPRPRPGSETQCGQRPLPAVPSDGREMLGGDPEGAAPCQPPSGHPNNPPSPFCTRCFSAHSSAAPAAPFV